jgi:ATP-dependent helicase/nuclease subunit A
VSDAVARERAARGYDRNVVVVAGAGTGKTTLLVERVLCQMVETGLELDRFAAITFTEKAAAELRKRMAESLTQLARLAEEKTLPEHADAHSAAGRAYRALRERGVAGERIASIALERRGSLSAAQLSTIHSFCAGLLRRYPLECGVDPGFRVDTGLGFEALKDELWSAFLVGPSGPDAADGAQQERWRRVLRDLDPAEVEALGRALAAFSAPAHAAARGLPDARPALDTLAGDALARLAACPFQGAEKGPESWLAAARGAFEALRAGGLAPFRAALDAGRWRNSRNDEKELLDEPPTSTKQPEATALAKELHRRLRKLRQVEHELLADAVALVRPFAEAVRAEARRRGILPFDALLWLTRELLRGDREVRRKLGDQYEVLFVDEFQDTDPIQYEIVFFLAEKPDLFPAAEAFQTRLAPGRLFIVGDPKQAIYRFRGADLAAYHAAVEHVVQRNGGVRYTLTCNWRARPEVLQPLGELLARQLAQPDDARAAAAYSGYDGLQSGREPAGERRVEMWRAGDAGAPASAEGSRRAEAQAIAGFIAGEVAAGRAKPGHFALLFRSLRGVRIYARALRERGLTCWIGRSDEPHREPAPQQLLALLRALANPADAPAVLGVLRSPLGAVPDAELARWAATFEPKLRARAWSFPDVTPPPEPFPNLARAFALLRELRARERTRAPADLLASLLEETPLVAIHAHARDGQRRRRDLESLLERLADAARAAPGSDVGDLVRALETSDPRSVEDDDARDDRVRLLTIHGAKGLEFEIVLLPDLAWYKSSLPRSVEVELVRAQGALAVATRAGISTSWLDFEAELALHETAELGRLFYVATTRARERLIFVDSYRKRAGARAGTLLEFLSGFVQVRDVGEPGDARLPLEPAPAATLQAAQARARAALDVAHTHMYAPFRSPSDLRDDRIAADETAATPRALPDLAAERARAIGVLAHEALERWDFRDADALRRLARDAALRAARRGGLDAASLESEAASLAASILASDLPAHLAGVEVLGRELPMLFRDDDGTPWSGTLDLLYRDASGQLVVADYKTDRAPDAEARASYRAQLDVYARAVARALPGERAPCAELIFLRSGRRERWTR